MGWSRASCGFVVFKIFTAKFAKEGREDREETPSWGRPGSAGCAMIRYAHVLPSFIVFLWQFWVRVMRSVYKLTACLCLALTLWSAVAVATHHHSSANESLTCRICIAANSTTPSVACAQPAPTFIRISTVLPRPDSAPRLVLAFAVSNRPPPVV